MPSSVNTLQGVGQIIQMWMLLETHDRIRLMEEVTSIPCGNYVRGYIP